MFIYINIFLNITYKEYKETCLRDKIKLIIKREQSKKNKEKD